MCVWVKTSKISPKVQRKAHVGQGIPSSCHTWLALTIFIAEAWKSWWWMIVLESCQRTMTRYKAKPSLVYQPALGLLCHQTSASIASPDVRCSIILHLQASSWSYWRHSTFRLHGIHPTVSNVLQSKATRMSYILCNFGQKNDGSYFLRVCQPTFSSNHMS